MIPHERTLVERLANEPFAILGINTDSAEAYAKGLAEEPVTWRSAMQGTTRGPIPTQWGVTGYPTLYLLDHEGRIVEKDGRLRDEAYLDRRIDELVAAAKAAQGGAGGGESGR